MTTYTSIATAEIDTDSAVTQALLTKVRDNPIAISEGSANSPVLSVGWHPYDMVTVGDGNDGTIYDFAVDGAVASVETPNFADGYEYLIFMDGISHSSGAAQNLQLDLYKETDAAYQNVHTSSATGAASEVWRGFFYIVYPRIDTVGHWVDSKYTKDTTLAQGTERFADATLQKILKARVQFTGGNIDLGKLRLMRRREFLNA